MRRYALLAFFLLTAVTVSAVAVETLTIASVHVKWLGFYEERNCEALAHALSTYDVVVVQGIVAPPYEGTYPDGSAFQPDLEVAEFFDEMTVERGFAYLLSSEDTGAAILNHSNTTRTEWYAVFYDPARLEPAPDVYDTFLADDVSAHPDYDRVPYAFGLRYRDTGFDFALIAVHLHWGRNAEDSQRRTEELAAIAEWIADQPDEEHFIILGDMNFEACNEALAVVPAGFDVLNPNAFGECLDTTTDLDVRTPADNAFTSDSVRVDRVFGMRVIDLVSGLSAIWNPLGEPIEDAYDDLDFVGQLSDHNPIVFKIDVPSGDND